MADIKLNTTNGSVTLKPEDGSGNVDITVPRAGLGKVLQVVSTSTATRWSFAGTITSWTDVPDLVATITPTSTTSKIMVLITMHVGCAYGGTNVQTRLVRDGTEIHNFSHIEMSLTTAITYHRFSENTSYLDSPSTTDEITYSTQVVGSGGSTGVYYLNRGNTDQSTQTSTITLIEIAN